MQLDRTLAPNYQPIASVKLPPYQYIPLANGCPFYVINVGQQPVMRLEVIFGAGVWDETKWGESFFTVKMLSEGTTQRSSAQISEDFDRIGAFLELGHTSDQANILTYGLPKHLEAILQMTCEMITEATFPERELENLKNITTQGVRLNLEKNAVVASIRYREQLFGHGHPYAWTHQEETIAEISQPNVVNFYNQKIKHQPFKVFLSGLISEAEIALVQQYLGSLSVSKPTETKPTFTPKTNPLAYHLAKPDALQASIRLGQFAMLRAHPDFYPFLVCNEILGGYFGSRLMKNIREDKGFTYGISSGLAILRNAAYFTIGTDVKKEFLDATLHEIQHEIAQLQTDLVSDDELETVKNFMAGEMAGSLNTPFEVADRVKLTVLTGLESRFYEEFIPNLRAITPEQVRDIAQRYFDYNNLIKVIVG